MLPVPLNPAAFGVVNLRITGNACRHLFFPNFRFVLPLKTLFFISILDLFRSLSFCASDRIRIQTNTKIGIIVIDWNKCRTYDLYMFLFEFIGVGTL